MCGILYVKKNKGQKVSKTVLKRFKKQKLRGIEGFGYIPIINGKVKEVKRFQTEKEVEKSIKQEETNEILFHHRIPTSTPNLSPVNHPITIKSDILKYNYYIIHNGVIYNAKQLKEEHEKLGFDYKTEMSKSTLFSFKNEDNQLEMEEEFFNDSETFAIDLALYLEDKQDKFESRGSVSFICLQTDKKNNVKRIHYGHNNLNPLVCEESKDMFILKSEGKGYDVEKNVIFSIDYKSNELERKDIDISSSYPSSSYSNSYSKYSSRDSYYKDKSYEKDFDDFDNDVESSFNKENRKLLLEPKKIGYHIPNDYSELEDDLEELKAEKYQKLNDLTSLQISIESGDKDESDEDVSKYKELLGEEIEDVEEAIQDKKLELECFEFFNSK